MCREVPWITTETCSLATLGIILPASSRFPCRRSVRRKTRTFPFGCGAKGRITTMQTKGRFDANSPAIKAYEQELAHQLVREGTMVAFPMCLPGMTTQITHDECRITALDINSDGHI